MNEGNSISFEDKKYMYHALLAMANVELARDYLLKPLKRKLYQLIVNNDKNNQKPKERLKEYHFIIALLESTVRNLKRGYISKSVFKQLVQTIVYGIFLESDYKRRQSRIMFQYDHGMMPPDFIALTISKKCSNNVAYKWNRLPDEPATCLPYQSINRVISESIRKFGCRFVVLYGGEPFLYNDTNKTILDLFKKYSQVFFLVFTDGTHLTEKIADQLADQANVSLVISLDGVKNQIDAKNGNGTYNTIMDSLDHLRKRGIPFGIQLNVDKSNIDAILKTNFYKYFFDEVHASFLLHTQLPSNEDRLAEFQPLSLEEKMKLDERIKEHVEKDRYCIADFSNNLLFNNPKDYERESPRYIYINADGNISHSLHLPYYVGNIHSIYKNGTDLSKAIITDHVVNVNSPRFKRQIKSFLGHSKKEHYRMN
ncbi:MAG: radical SAM protein [Bacteroidota bacterium]